jgi:glycosyltransferase involved in cell wall biosynthesis
MALALVLCCCGNVLAGDDFGYYWYHTHVAAYPTGKGLVYATQDSNVENPNPELFAEEMTVKFVNNSSDADLYLFNRPAEGYGFNGWYRWEDGQVSSFLSWNTSVFGLFSPSSLSSTWSEDNETEHYSEDPNDEVVGVFGRVSIKRDVDNLNEVIAAVPDSEVFGAMFIIGGILDNMEFSIDNPCNEIGDNVMLSAAEVYKDSVTSVDEITGVETKEYKDVVVFTGWTDTKGNHYTSSELKLKVTEHEVYTAHYQFIDNSSSGIKSLPINESKIHKAYSLSGAVLTSGKEEELRKKLKSGFYIINGKKILLKSK